MKRYGLLATCLLIVLAVIGFSVSAQKRTVSRQQWEYFDYGGFALKPDTVDNLNKLGAEGWELVATNGSGNLTYYHFKRLKK